MAYAQSGLNAHNHGSRVVWLYETADPIETVLASGYFSNGDEVGMTAGDIVHVLNTTDYTVDTIVVSSVTSGGAAAVKGMTSQELTATGAVLPGVTSVELNHATVVIAATIATSLDHQGLFVVKNTSASGTAAHTLTLTAGTFNGTNNVATLNAPNEALVVWFDSAGDGTIVENVGTVGLS